LTWTSFAFYLQLLNVVVLHCHKKKQLSIIFGEKSPRTTNACGPVMRSFSSCVHTHVTHIQYQFKVWTHLLIPGFFFLFLYFLHGRITHMESCSSQKSVKSKYILYLSFFKVATLCLEDSFATFWHSLNQLHEVVTWNLLPYITWERSRRMNNNRFCTVVGQDTL
jgi:hypothetical protein